MIRKYDAELIGRRIKERRKELGITQKELADKSGILLQSIKQYETGRRAPSDEWLIYIANALGVYKEWLVGEIEDKNFQQAQNKREYLEREQRLAEAHEKMESWSEDSRKSFEQLHQDMLISANKPLYVFDNILMYSKCDLDYLEHIILVDYGMSRTQFEELTNAFFHRILDFVRHDYTCLCNQANNKKFYDDYVREVK